MNNGETSAAFISEKAVLKTERTISNLTHFLTYDAYEEHIVKTVNLAIVSF